MKTIITIMSLFLYGTSSFAQYNLDSLCLDLKGYVQDDYGHLKDAQVSLYMENVFIKKLTTNHSGKFEFLLNRNHIYTIKVTRQNYLSEKICVNTYMPEIYSSAAHKIQVYDFDIELEEEKKYNLNADVFDFPVALLYYDRNLNQFDYSRAYSDNIRKEWIENRVDMIAGQHE